jgi:hypothetical protein
MRTLPATPAGSTTATAPAGTATPPPARTTAPTPPVGTTATAPAGTDTSASSTRVAFAAAPPDEAVLVDRFLRAVIQGDEATLFTLLDPDVWLRAMLVREVIEERDAVATIARLHGWFGSAVAREVLHAATSPVASRHHLSYRFLLRPVWAPDVWHLIEQSGYARVRDGRISRLDLVCTGFHPHP